MRVRNNRRRKILRVHKPVKANFNLDDEDENIVDSSNWEEKIQVPRDDRRPMHEMRQEDNCFNNYKPKIVISNFDVILQIEGYLNWEKFVNNLVDYMKIQPDKEV